MAEQEYKLRRSQSPAHSTGFERKGKALPDHRQVAQRVPILMPTSTSANSNSAITLNRSSEPIQLQTKINHTAAKMKWADATGIVGTGMSAVLDPEDIVVGSETASSLMTDLDVRVASLNKGKWARGHLLNHDLGGFGVPENLFPISSSANSHHAQTVEYPVKRMLDESKLQIRALKFHGGSSLGVSAPRPDDYWIHYNVTVAGTPTYSQFQCSWKKGNEANFKTATIPSHLKEPNEAAGPTPGWFRAAGNGSAPHGWGHQGQGYRNHDFGQYVDNGKISVSGVNLPGQAAVERPVIEGTGVRASPENETPLELSEDQRKQISENRAAAALHKRFEMERTVARQDARNVAISNIYATALSANEVSGSGTVRSQLAKLSEIPGKKTDYLQKIKEETSRLFATLEADLIKKYQHLDHFGEQADDDGEDSAAPEEQVDEDAHSSSLSGSSTMIDSQNARAMKLRKIDEEEL